ncbi:MAG TPA: Asp23/Gls24 family envelope stress response protein [Anaerolineales bacterium]|nr:Asp23/Gls24 family envelope stress response protein [Anaerolineales bacterium]
MTTENAAHGRITVSTQAIATIASRAALGTYGVVGMSSRSFADGIGQMLVRDPHRGIDVHAEAEAIQIDAYVIVEYGTRVSAVANSVANSIRYQVEHMLGMPVAEVNVHVQDLRVSNVD